jgi:excisionase family DNA binding protein
MQPSIAKPPRDLPQVHLFDDIDPRPTPTLAVTINDACRATGLGSTTVYELIADGEIEAVKVGRRTIILWQSLLDYLTRCPRLRGGQAANSTEVSATA